MRVRLLISFSALSLLALVLYALLAAAGVPGPAAIALVVTAAVGAGLSSLFDRSIRRAAEFAGGLVRGDRQRRLPETGGGATGDLYRALNRAAEALRITLEQRGAEQTETELLLREMGEGVLALDSAGRVVRANPHLRSIIGAGEPLEGRAVATLFRNPQLVEFLTPAAVPVEGRQAEFEVFGRTILVVARRLPAGGVVAVFSDLSELRRLDRVRTEFVANASHELKTPLTAIRGYAETLQSHDVAPDDRSRFADRIVEHAERMTALVEDLLTLARLEDAGSKVRREPVPLLPLIEKIVAATAERSARAGVATSVQVEPPGLAVDGDPEGVRQILENLVDNTIRHSNAHNLRVVAAALPGREVRISVADDGQGIPAAHTNRMFERFYRVDASRSRETGGTGLGLSIVKHWTEVMGGSVQVESTLGEGTQIQITLPAAGP